MTFIPVPMKRMQRALPAPECGNCRAYTPMEPIGYDRRGACRFNPPHPERRHPVVRPNEWCFQHQPK